LEDYFLRKGAGLVFSLLETSANLSEALFKDAFLLNFSNYFFVFSMDLTFILFKDEMSSSEIYFAKTSKMRR